jgi:hypothetical protein
MRHSSAKDVLLLRNMEGNGVCMVKRAAGGITALVGI